MTIDLTGVAATVIAGIFSILAIVLPMMIQARMKDKQAAEVLGNAVKNALGAMQQATTAQLRLASPEARVVGATPSMAVGVQYVLDNAGAEAERFGITPEAIASKINAQVGLANIASNISTAASPGPSPAPLAAVAPAVPEAREVAPLQSPGYRTAITERERGI